jgi:hypothetical protein
MPRSIIRTATTAIAIAVLAAPTALARPADTSPSVAKAAANAEQEQDLRHLRAGGHVVDAAAQHKQDARSPGARVGTYTPGATPAVTYTSGTNGEPARAQPGPPTWPVNPQPITSAPAAKVTDGGNGVDWMTLGLGIAGSLLAIGAVAGITSRTRRSGRARIAA